MTERACTSVYVHLFVGNMQIAHGGQGNHGKGLVDLEQIDVLNLPLQTLHQLSDGVDWSGGELRGIMCKACVAADTGKRLETVALGG